MPPSPFRTLRGRLLLAASTATLSALLAIGAVVWELDHVGRFLALANRVYLPLGRLSGRMEARLEQPAAIVPLVEEAHSLLDTPTTGLDAEEELALAAARTEVAALAAALALDPGPKRRASVETEVLQLGRLADARVRVLSLKTARLQARALQIGAVGAAISLLVGAGVVWITGQALRPIERLTRHARQIGAGEEPPPLDPVGPEELQVLARAFSTMLSEIRARELALQRAEEHRQHELRQMERLALVGQLLAQVTHEVRNPLNAIALHVELLEDTEMEPEGRAIVATILREVRRLEALTRRYLSLSRRREPAPVPVELATLLSQALQLERAASDRLGLSLTLLEPAPPPARVEAGEAGEAVEIDRDALQQVLLNLIRNAAEAGASAVEVAARWEAGVLTLSVTDDGPGIDASLKSTLFEPFTTTRPSGTGLGLAIVRQLVEDQRGSVSVEAAQAHPRRGTRFLLTWPAPAHTAPKDPDEPLDLG